MITIAIPTWNRTDLLFESYSKVLDDPRVSEIVIVDDCSKDEVWRKLCDTIGPMNNPKIKLFRNEKNLDCYFAKREAVSKATNEWVILLDSDNIIDKEYIDRICSMEWGNRIILQPSFAKPHFNFTEYAGYIFDRSSVKNHIHESSFSTMLNAMNFFVNRDEYLRVWDGSVDPVTSDSLYFNYKWIEAGNWINVVRGLEYEHRVNSHGKEEGSHYQNNVKRTPKGFHESIINKLKAMK